MLCLVRPLARLVGGAAGAHVVIGFGDSHVGAVVHAEHVEDGLAGKIMDLWEDFMPSRCQSSTALC